MVMNVTRTPAQEQGRAGLAGMRVCILTAVREPFDERLFYKIGQSLRDHCQSVTVVAPWSKPSDEVAGIHILGMSPRKGRLARLARLRELFRTALTVRADVYQCEELDAWIVGALLQRRLGCRLVYDAHECNIADLPSRSPWLLRPLVFLLVLVIERALARRSQIVLPANQITRGYYLLLNRFLHIPVLYNVPRLSLFRDADEGSQRPFDFCHEGHLPFNRGLKRMVRALLEVRREFPAVRLLIVGDVFREERKWLDEQIRTHHLEETICATGWLPYPEVGQHVARCRIGLIGMEPTPNNMLAGPPNKLFNYMRYGMPVLAPDFPEIGRIVNESQCGITYRPGDDQALCQCMLELMRNPEKTAELGMNATRAARQVYNWEETEKDLLHAYAAIVVKAAADQTHPV